MISIPKSREPSIIFYILQPLDRENKDHRLHLQAEDETGIKFLKRWLHDNAYRKVYYYDRITEYYTIKKLGKMFLEKLERNSLFQMVEGIPEL